MPAATKHVRFASTNTTYSFSSRPSTTPCPDSSTKPVPSSTYVSSTAKSTSSSSGSEKSIPSLRQPAPKVRRHPTTQLRPSYAGSRSSSSSSSSSRSSSSQTSNTSMSQSGIGSIQLHFLLAYSPLMQSCLNYDLSQHPSVLADYYSSASLLEPATNPPVLSLTITCRHYLKWPVFVTPSKYLRVGYVTVADVLDCLYRDLRSTVRQEEYDSYLPNPETKRIVDAAYFSRCSQIADPDARQDEHLKGVKRVDFLMGRNQFTGLIATRKHPNIWELKVA